MTFKAQLDKKVGAFIKKPRRKSVPNVTSTDLAADLKGLHIELQRQVIPTAVGYAGTIVRKKAQDIVRNGGTDTTLGKSYKTMTRGVPFGSGMKNVGRGSWSRKVVKRRGQNAKSLADPKGIIKKGISRKERGLMTSQIVGPRYQTGLEGDTIGKNFAHVHEPVQGKRSVHVYWGRRNKLGKKTGIHKVRPFMEPAGRLTQPAQKAAIIRALKRWDIRSTDFD